MVALYVLALLFLILCLSAAFTAYTARKVERLLPAEGRFLDIDGQRIHYLDLGHGPPIVMIHGLACQTQTFTYALTARLANSHRLIVFDRPGSGYSLPRRGSPNIRAQAEVLAKAIEALKLYRPLIAGHSLGGAIALAMAEDAPWLAGGLALIAPLTQAFSTPEMFKALDVRPALLRWFVSWTVATPLGLRNTPKVLALAFAPEKVSPDYATKAGGLLGLRPGAYRAASADLVSANSDLPALISRYGEIKIPVSILYGTEDAVLDYKLHALPMKDAIPHAQVQLLPRGHMLPLTAPAETAEFILQAEKAVKSAPA